MGNMKRASIACCVAAAALLSTAAFAHAQGDDNSRAVRIIDGTSAPAAAPTATALSPAAPVDVRQISIRSENSAGLDLAILPDVELATGSTVTFRIATKKPGYLILVDVDAAGKLTQIYPNRHSLQTRESRESLNLIKPGPAITIPRRDDPFAGFEFVASPPAGIAMIVAILSDRPVHLIDLPDVAPPQSGQVAFDQLFEVARQLRISREDDAGTLQEPKWSFDAKLYVVR
jgi:hypothetical protein